MNKFDLEKNIKLINFIDEVVHKNPSKKYNKFQIEEFIKLVKSKNIEDLIKFIFEEDINLKEAIPTNYRKSQIVYNKSKDMNLIKKFKEYQMLKSDLKILLDKNSDFLCGMVENNYKNASRKKGGLFKKIITEILKSKEFEDENILSNLEIYFNLEDVERNNLKKSFLYIPKQDFHIYKYLKKVGISIKNEEKGRDILIFHENRFYIGEVKEINESGGSQNHQINDLISCSNINENNIKGFGVMYGAFVFYDNKYLRELKGNENIFLITDFLFNIEKIIVK